jgi:hypothetical protein
MKHSTYSHCAGDTAIPDSVQKEILTAISEITIKPARGAVRKIRSAFLTSLKSAGWSSQVTVAEGSNITITSMKDAVGLCLQTGNMARMYADLMKLQTLHREGAIRAAAIVLPSNRTAKLLGGNVADSKRLERELNIFKKAYDVPTMVFGLE